MPGTQSVRTLSAPVRLALTVVTMGAMVALSFVPLPIVADDMSLARRFRIGALGLGPAVSAIVLVEWAALIVRPWRGLRLGGPEGRRALGRVAILLTAALAIFQAFGIASSLEESGGLFLHGGGTRSLVCLSLCGFTMLFVLGVTVVDRWGFGNGFSIGILASVLKEVVPGLMGSVRAVAAGAQRSVDALMFAGKAGCIALIAFWALRAVARSDEAGSRSSLALPVLACGVIPIEWVPNVLMLPAVLKRFYANLSDYVPEPNPDALKYIGLRVVLLVTATVVAARVFQSPRRVARLLARAEALKGAPFDASALERDAARLLRVTIVKAVCFVALVEIVRETPPAPFAPTHLVWLVVGTAIGLDFASEWRARRAHADLVSVWPEHRVYAAHAARTILEEAGIFVLLRGLHHRTCLQFLGPHVPIDVMVPAAYAEQARSLVNGVLDERFGPAVTDEPRARWLTRADGV